MGVLDDILVWGKTRPAWQQAALQLLYESPRLSDDNLKRIVELCKKEHGLEVPAKDVPALVLGGTANPTTPNSVLLLQVSDVENVNALRPGQNLSFARTGITLVFGDNGVGKSGYVRVLKQGCRARGAPDQVYQNAYSDDSTPPSALISYSVGAEDRSFRWGAGAIPPAELHDISILDSKAAMVYANDEQPIAYLPFGLDLFQRLAALCDSVRDAVEVEISKEGRDREKFPDVKSGTMVRMLLDGIDQPHLQKQLAERRIVSEQELQELEALLEEVARLRVEDPETRAVELEHKARRVQSVRDRLAARIVDLADVAARGATEARHAALHANTVAKVAMDAAFGHFPVGGLSDETWKALWKAASEFASKGAIPHQQFPPEKGHLCILCQQPIGDEAAVRLSSFQAFLRDKTQADAVSADTRLVQALAPFRVELALSSLEETQAEELDALEAGTGAACRLAFIELNQRAADLLNGAAQPMPLSANGTSAVAACDRICVRLRTDAAVLRTATEMGRLATAIAKIEELEARQQLTTIWERVETEVARCRRIERLQECLRGTNTISITNEGKRMLAAAVSQPMTDRFNANLKALRLDHIPIEFAPAKGKKGSAVHRARLKAKRSIENDAVLSEGEFRAIAVAGFLAEVEQHQTGSTLVFDDPVSSLDLDRREFVANALAEIAKQRPVIVFTHDMPFAWQLTDAADSAGVPVLERQLRRSGNGAGMVSNTMATSGLPAKRRVGPLKQRATELKKAFDDNPEQYERDARQIYNELRETWERGVEDSLLNGGLRRFGKEVKTQSLARLHLVTEVQMDRLDRAMTKCSALMHGHDQSAALGRPVPDPVEVLADVVECENWLNELKKQYEKKSAA